MSLDAIDRAYIAHEFPLRIFRAPQVTEREFRSIVDSFLGISRLTALVLPPDTFVETVAPQSPHPFELARWADDGGRV